MRMYSFQKQNQINDQNGCDKTVEAALFVQLNSYVS